MILPRLPAFSDSGCWLSLIAVKLLLPILIVLASGSGCARFRPQTTALDKLAPCVAEQGPTDAYCGELEVWENRAAKAGRKLKLKIVLLPGLSRTSAPDPVFFFAGGPGAGAAKMAGTLKDHFRRLQTDRDIVLVDQRGTGNSNPLNCEFKNEDDHTVDRSPEEYLALLKGCLAKYDADVRLYTTEIAMDDIDDVRAFLGYEKINLYGGSYGTRAAITYLRRHGGRVRSVVLDGVAPPDMRLPLYMPRDGQRALDLMFRDCDADTACRARFPNLREKVQRLFTRLAAKPERVHFRHPRSGKEQDVTVKASMIAGVVFNAMYFPELASLLPMLFDRAEKGDYQGLFAMTAGFGGIAQTMSTGMHYSVVCAEDAPRIDRATIAKETEATFLGAEIVNNRLKPCDFWPRNPVDPAFYEPLVSGVPALVLSGELDPVTPPVWGEQMAKQLKNSRHFAIPGAGHGTTSNGCVLRMTADFVKAASADGLKTECLKRLKRTPFFLTPAGPDPGGLASEEGGKP